MNENDENRKRLYFIRIKKNVETNKTKEFRKNFGLRMHSFSLSLGVCGIMNI